LTHYSPEANNLNSLKNDFYSLYSKKDIYIKNYNHSNGKFDPKEIFTYKNSIILDGLHSLYTYDIYKYMKYKIFVLNHNCDNLKIKRDVEERNKKVEDVVKSIKEREPDYELYIEPQKNNANIIIEIFKSRLKILFKKEEFIKLENIFKYENIFYFEDDEFFQLNFNYFSLDEYKNYIKNIFKLIKRYN
jgi:phosphoribulokinase